MKRIFIRFAACALLLPAVLGLAADSGPAGPEAFSVNPDSYPGIGAEEMGQLRYFLALADEPVPDFSALTGDGPGESAYRYSIAFMTYFLALEQYHKLPACPEIIRPRLERLIEKMIAKPTWEYWAVISRGLPHLEPRLDRPYPESHDPVADQNIMYSGHLGHMIGLLEMLYRDLKWDKPGSIVFAWSDSEKYVYDNNSLNRVMYEQMHNNPWHGIACEPNAVFPSCNQHPILSFMLYDAVHGTRLADAREEFLESALAEKLVNQKSRHFGGYYLVKQDLTVGGVAPAVSPSMDGWAGTFMHAWQPELIERMYPYQRDYHIALLGSAQPRINRDLSDGQGLKYGFFAMLAAEVGDNETRDKLLVSADARYQPRWKDGAFYYPVNPERDASFLTGVLQAVARANLKNGVYAMHNAPFDQAHFKAPFLSGVEFPRVLLARAIYDANKKALIITTEPGQEKQGTSELTVNNLDPAKSYRLMKDGRQVKIYQAAQSATIEVALDQRHDLVLAEK
jgi:hypothetical protein